MQTLQGFQKKYLRGQAHHLKPVVMIGQKGVSQSVLREIEEVLSEHELIKIKFIDFKEKEQKTMLAGDIERLTSSHLVGMIGHTAIYYREHPDSSSRKIVLPSR